MKIKQTTNTTVQITREALTALKHAFADYKGKGGKLPKPEFVGGIILGAQGAGKDRC